MTVTGYVVDEHGRPALSDGKKRLRISAHFQRRQVGYVRLEDDGSFRFEKVPDGEIALRVNGYPRFESASAKVPGGSQGVRIQLKPGRFRER